MKHIGWLRVVGLALLTVFCAACADLADPLQAAILVEVAEQRIEQRDLGRALDLYEIAAQVDPRAVPLRHALAQHLIEAGRHPEAWHHYYAIQLIVATRSPGDDTAPEESFAAGCALLITNQVVAADRLLRVALERHPNDRALLQVRGIALYRRKRFEAALELLLKADRRVQVDSAGAHWASSERPFPDAVPRLLMKAAFRQFFIRFLASSQPRPEPAKMETLLAASGRWFPEWGLADAAHGKLLDERQDRAGAQAAYERAVAREPWNIHIIRAARLFHVREGHYRRAEQLWRGAAPARLVLQEENQFRDRFVRLETATAQAERDAGEASLLALARAYDRLGWTDEAVAVARAAPVKSVAGQEFRRAIEAHAELLRQMSTYLEVAYLGTQSGEPMPNIQTILAFVQRAGSGTGAIAFDPEHERDSAFLSGSEHFPTTDPGSPLASYFRSHGQFFLITQSWGPPIVKLTNILYTAETERVAPGNPDRAVRHRWVLGDEGRIFSLHGFMANRPRIAGLTGIGATGFLVDAQSLRPEFIRPPSAPRQGLIRYEMLPDEASTLLARRSWGRPVEGSGPEKQARFDQIFTTRIINVANHEFGHLVDLHHHLPLLAHIGANLNLLIRHGFSPARIRARGEAVAEAASLALAEDPYRVVRKNLLWMQDGRSAPYWWTLVHPAPFMTLDSPYRAAGEAILREVLDRAADRLKQTDRFKRGVPVLLQLQMLAPSELRAIGVAISNRHGQN